MLTSFLGTIRPIALSSSYDVDAAAFIAKVELSTSLTITEKNLIDRHVRDLKGEYNPSYATSNQWALHEILMIFIGGTASSFKWNLKDPRDLDAAYRMTFGGGWVHSPTGSKPNGINAFGDSKYVISRINDFSMSLYSRTDISAPQVDCGAQTSNATYLLYSFSGTPYKSFNSSEGVRGTALTPTTGLLMGNRASSTSEKYYKNGVLVDNLTISSTVAPTSPIYIGCRSTAGPSFEFPSSKEICYFQIGKGLSDTDAANFYASVQALNTGLGRAI